MVKPTQQYYRLKSIKEIKKLLSCNNQVLARTVDKNEESRTKAGLYKVGDTDFQPAKHANRISEVVMVPDTLYFGLTWHKVYPHATESMPWRTEQQLLPGDIIWHSYMDSLNCPMITCEDEPEEEYKLLNYYDIYVAKREIAQMSSSTGFTQSFNYGNEQYIKNGNSEIYLIVPLNGYILCEEVKEEKLGDLDVLDKHIDQRFGKVAFIGKKVTYRRERIGKPPVERDFDGDDEFVPGDIIIKKNPKIHILLEDPLHCRFNGNTLYFVIQRKDIYAKYETNNNSNS